MPKKDFARDYATEAFRFYAKCGKPTYDELYQKIYDEAMKSSQGQEHLGIQGGISKPTEQTVLKADSEVERRKAELLDVLAVERVLWKLKEDKKDVAEKIIEMVYFVDADKELEKGDIARRVDNASLEIPMSEAQIYRYLRLARMLFCEERGLRHKNSSKDDSTSTKKCATIVS